MFDFVKKYKIPFITIGAIVLCAVIGVSVFFGTAHMRAYDKGVELLESKDYAGAISVFETLGDYKDSSELLEEAVDLKTEEENSAKYQEAVQLYNAEDYEKALEIFTELGNYKDSQQMADDAENIILIQNDVTPPSMSYKNGASLPEITVNPGASFRDFSDQVYDIAEDIDVSDDVTEEIEIDYNAIEIDTDTPGSHELIFSATDEAGNTSEMSTTVHVRFPVAAAFYDATHITKFDLEGPSPFGGTYKYNGFTIPEDEVEWLDEGWASGAFYLNQDVLYNSIAKALEGFYVLSDFYGNWGGGTVEAVLGIEKKPTYDEMKPYIDKVSTLFTTDDRPYIPVLNNLSQCSTFEGTADPENFSFDFKITDLTATANELGITEEALGYLFAMLDCYQGLEFFFEDNSVVCPAS